jgi:hypothetical protein
MAPLAIIFFGFILQIIKPEKNKKRLVLFFLIIAILVSLNVAQINTAFLELKNDPRTTGDYITAEDIFPDTNRVTLAEQQDVADYIHSEAAKNNYPVYLNIASEYAPSFWYLLEKRGVHYLYDFNKKSTYTQGDYFSVNYANKPPFKNIYFEDKDSKIFGKLRVQYLQPLQPIALRQPDSEIKVRPDLAVMSKLLTWKKLFAK